MRKDTIITVSIILLGLIMYGLTLHGVAGNPRSGDFKGNLDQAGKPFELSPERGRYIHVVSLAETGNYAATSEWADVAYPDVGISKDGRYYSFFAPGVAYFAAPFYMLGSKYGYAQLASFAVEPIVTIVTLIFIFLIGRKIFQLPRWASFFAVLMYAFASTSWSYAVTLYQNAFTTCLIVTAFYAVWRFQKNDTRHAWLYAAYVWLAYAVAVLVDYPNLVLFMPIMVYLAYTTLTFNTTSEGYRVTIRYASIIAFVGFLCGTGFHFWHNAHYYGKWSNLAGTLTNYQRPFVTEKPSTYIGSTISGAFVKELGYKESTTTPQIELANVSLVQVFSEGKEKTAAGFFHEYKIPHGFYILMFSDQRGLLFFSPIFIFSLFGIAYAFKRKIEDKMIYIIPFSLIALNLTLYSSWGDPWGGWAYGPRYLIPSMPWLALFAVTAIASGRWFVQKRIIAFELFIYSSAIALLGVLTTNAVPTKSEGLLLPAKAYNFLYNLSFMRESHSSSFAYNTFFRDDITLFTYFLILYAVIVLLAAVTLFIGKKEQYE